DVQESYHDVHYRTSHRTLIAFSNEHFYGNRLQALPGHPDRQTLIAPVRLQRVGGVYEQRTNRREAEAVVALVDELLLLDEPPSLGIATFNLAQRDLIGDLLTERADEDPAFRGRYGAARNLTRSGAFEGLFVKNLENVQGDERDHIIISTTYGPDPEGKFFRRFGPLGTRGGGRRLNVLVTRARHKIHLLTSIPTSAYRHEQALPTGGTPSGSWLLFAYLRYAEAVEEWFRHLEATGQDLREAQRDVEEAQLDELTVRSRLVDATYDRMVAAAETDGSAPTIERYWGNDGFCVDLVVRHPGLDGRGLLIDFARYEEAPDPIEWDLFATALMRRLGWTLRRIFSPRIARDPNGSVESSLGRADAEAETSGSR
ncbi:MAG: AAA domain-containing protein, partial [Acidobacteriota bacterium]